MTKSQANARLWFKFFSFGFPAKLILIFVGLFLT